MPDKFAKGYVLTGQLRVVEISPFLLVTFKLNYMYTLEEDSINGVKIDEEIFDYEKSEWKIIHRESFIDELYHWISEAIRADRADAQLMKDDLFMLAKWDDEYIFSSISTNDYIGENDSRFNETCEELIKLNNKYVYKLIEVKIKVLVEYNSSVLDPQDVLDMAHIGFRKEDDGPCMLSTDDIEITDYLSESFKKITK